MDESAVLLHTIRSLDVKDPVRIIFELLNRDQVKRLLAILSTPKAERRAAIENYLREVFDGATVVKFREQLQKIVTVSTLNYVLFTYLPIYLLIVLIVVVLAIYQKLQLVPALIILFIGAILLFLMSAILYAVAQQKVLGIFQLSSIVDKVESLLDAVVPDLEAKLHNE